MAFRGASVKGIGAWRATHVSRLTRGGPASTFAIMKNGRAWIGLALMTMLLAPVPARADSGVSVRATIGGTALDSADANNPLVLRPSDSTVVTIAVTNRGSSPVSVRAVRLRATVLRLAFFSYTTRVDLTVAPGATGTRTFLLDLSDLDGQATGLLPAELALLAPNRSEVFLEKGTVDVKGKVLSVYGVFGLAVAGITALLLLTLVLRLFRRTLPDSRWSRAVLFGVPGLGLGMVATFTLGVLRVLVPSVGTAVALLAGGAVVGLVLGYLTPAPGDEADRDELDERDVVPAAAVQVPIAVAPPEVRVPEQAVPAVVPPASSEPSTATTVLAAPAPPSGLGDGARETRVADDLPPAPLPPPP